MDAVTIKDYFEDGNEFTLDKRAGYYMLTAYSEDDMVSVAISDQDMKELAEYLSEHVLSPSKHSKGKTIQFKLFDNVETLNRFSEQVDIIDYKFSTQPAKFGTNETILVSYTHKEVK